MNGIYQGSGGSNRVGLQCKFTTLSLRYTISIPDGGDQLNFVRVVILRHKLWSQSATIAPQVYFDDYSSAIININATVRWDNRKVFKILYDKTHALTSGGTQNITRNVNIKLGFKTDYVGTSDSPTMVQHNGLIMLVWSDSAAIPSPTLEYAYRLKWQDL